MSASDAGQQTSEALEVDAIRRRAVEEGERSGRAAAQGSQTPLKDSPARKWIEERFGELIATTKERLTAERQALVVELEVTREELDEADQRLASAQSEYDELNGRWNQELDKPHIERNLGLDAHVKELKKRIERLREERHSHDVNRERYEERIVVVEQRLERMPETLQETCEAVLAEHDMAWERAYTSMSIGPGLDSPPAPAGGEARVLPEERVSWWKRLLRKLGFGREPDSPSAKDAR